MKTFWWGRVHPFLLRQLRTVPSTQQFLKYVRWKMEWMISAIWIWLWEVWIQPFQSPKVKDIFWNCFLVCQMRMAVPIFLSKSFGELEIWTHSLISGTWVIKWSCLTETQTDVNPSLGESRLTQDFIPSMRNWHQNKPRWGLNEIISPDLGSGNCEKYALIKARTSSNTTGFPFPTLSMRFPSKLLLIRCLKNTYYTFKNIYFSISLLRVPHTIKLLYSSISQLLWRVPCNMTDLGQCH